MDKKKEMELEGKRKSVHKDGSRDRAGGKAKPQG